MWEAVAIFQNDAETCERDPDSVGGVLCAHLGHPVRCLLGVGHNPGIKTMRYAVCSCHHAQKSLCWLLGARSGGIAAETVKH